MKSLIALLVLFLGSASVLAAAQQAPVTIPSWVARIALPRYPPMPLLAYVLLGLGILLLLIGYFAPIKKMLSLLAALSMLAYYPLAYLLHWFVFRHNEEARALREPTTLEEYLHDYIHVFDWLVLGICAFLGLLFLVWTVWATVRKGGRRRASTPAEEGNPFAQETASSPVASAQPAAARPSAPRPATVASSPAPKVAKKTPPPDADNPFRFT